MPPLPFPHNSDGAWHHCAVTWDGVSLKAYVDGVEDGSEPAPGVCTSTHPSWLLTGLLPGNFVDFVPAAGMFAVGGYNYGSGIEGGVLCDDGAEQVERERSRIREG